MAGEQSVDQTQSLPETKRGLKGNQIQESKMQLSSHKLNLFCYLLTYMITLFSLIIIVLPEFTTYVLLFNQFFAGYP